MLPTIPAPASSESLLITYALAIVGAFTLIEMIAKKFLWLVRELAIGAVDHYYDVVDHFHERRARNMRQSATDTPSVLPQPTQSTG